MVEKGSRWPQVALAVLSLATLLLGSAFLLWGAEAAGEDPDAFFGGLVRLFGEVFLVIGSVLLLAGVVAGGAAATLRRTTAPVRGAAALAASAVPLGTGYLWIDVGGAELWTETMLAWGLLAMVVGAFAVAFTWGRHPALAGASGAVLVAGVVMHWVEFGTAWALPTPLWLFEPFREELLTGTGAGVFFWKAAQVLWLAAVAGAAVVGPVGGLLQRAAARRWGAVVAGLAAVAVLLPVPWFVATPPAGADGLAAVAWWLAWTGGVVLLVAAVPVAFSLVRSTRGQAVVRDAAATAPAAEPEPEEPRTIGDAYGIDLNGPKRLLRCPSCAHRFSVLRHVRPACPACSFSA